MRMTLQVYSVAFIMLFIRDSRSLIRFILLSSSFSSLSFLQLSASLSSSSSSYYFSRAVLMRLARTMKGMVWNWEKR
jgi:hypothetical protein